MPINKRIVKLNDKGDYVALFDDGHRVFSASLIEASIAKEELKGIEVGTPIKISNERNVFKAPTSLPSSNKKPTRSRIERAPVEVPKDGVIIIKTAKQLRAEVVSGAVVFNKRGRSIPCSMIASKTPERKLNGVLVQEGKKKTYYLTNF